KHLDNLQRIFARHSHYNPNQPRVPAGHSDGGQWTRIGAGVAQARLIGAPSPAWPFGLGSGTGLEPPIPLSPTEQDPWPLIAAAAGRKPGIPTKRPPTSRERTEALKEAAKWLRENAGTTIDGIPWLDEFLAIIESYNDSPQTLEELRRAASDPKKGY